MQYVQLIHDLIPYLVYPIDYTLLIKKITRIKKIKSKRESKAVGKLIFSPGVFFTLYLPKRGLAAHNKETRAFKVVCIPALEIEMVCCSITYR